MSIYDLNNSEARQAARSLRMSIGQPPVEPETAKEVVGILGGRLSYLNRVLTICSDGLNLLHVLICFVLIGIQDSRYGDYG